METVILHLVGTHAEHIFILMMMVVVMMAVMMIMIIMVVMMIMGNLIRVFD